MAASYLTAALLASPARPNRRARRCYSMTDNVALSDAMLFIEGKRDLGPRRPEIDPRTVSESHNLTDSMPCTAGACIISGFRFTIYGTPQVEICRTGA